jgi:Secretion system C-terminal sorting domain
MKNQFLYLLAICSLFCTVLNVNAQHGVGPEWSAEVPLPNAPGSSSSRGFLYSNIAVFSNGKRVVFLNRQDGPGGIYYTSSYDGINWTVPTLFTPSNLVVGLNSPKIISDQNDEMHIVWASQLPKVLYYSKMDSALNVLVDSVRIADNPEFSNYQAVYLTNDLQNRIHVMWNEGKTGVDLPESYYSRSIDGGLNWSVKDTISTDDSFPSAFPRGQFNAYSGDTLAIFWRDSSSLGVDNWDIQMVVSEDGGVSWSAPQLIDSHINMQGDPDLVIDPLGRFHLFFHEADVANPYWGMRIVYGYSDDLGMTWSPSSTFQDTVSLAQRSYLAEGSRYDIVNGVLWTFWKEEDMLGLQGGDMMAAYSTDRGDNWSTPEYVTDRNDSTIGFKAVALLPDGRLAINYELPNYPSTGLFTVFYKERIASTASLTFNDQGQSLIIYPNPTNNVLNINFGLLKIDEVELYNFRGQLVFKNNQVADQNTLQFNLESFEIGTYILKIRTEDGIIVKKVVKM